MFRIDDNTYIDTSLITCAEYQLFIDEMHAQGHFFQPDHWTSYRFPKNNALLPISGVRPSDAISFCKWLTQREDNEWQYRIPTLREGNANPIQDLKAQAFGYWALSREKSKIIALSIRGVDTQFNLDLDQDHELNLNLTRYLEKAFARNEVLIRERERIRNSALNRSRIGERHRDLDLILVHDQEVVHKLSNDNEIEKAIERVIKSNSFDLAILRDLNSAQKIALDNVSRLVKAIANTINRARISVSEDHRIVVDDLERTYNLTRKRIDALVRNPDRANKLILDLDEKHVQDLNLAQEIKAERDHMLTYALDHAKAVESTGSIADDYDINLAYELISALDHARLQAVARMQNDPNKQKYNNNFEPVLNHARTFARDLYRFLLIPKLIDSLQNILLLRFRIMNELVATEGIRVVKERKQEPA